ncbi:MULTISPECIES: InlB B-repeat-containing protein [Gordonibacter]|uniref:InlB B-repeat-containing protein n=1 Tax=Gordonibacter faecis TaxID=3047475 RepID=A0ABT7DQQ5_9ACTN|nr:MULTISPECIES: InlB B-repeat-containing protein [unclassified Gordonibacter]MDJ1651880.1 InlB B-repeat-containing protein [Gordonibacter sp. KGMB12511]HIW76601.1 InlB B-repeat-containing protein [Candidatus Gordonibacter avicola]
MPSTRYISKPSMRHVGAGVLVLLFALITAVTFVMPVARAYATGSGSTSLGIMIIDSSKDQSASPGTTSLGIRVTNSGETFVTEYTLTLNFNDNSGKTSTVKATYNRLLSAITDLPSRTGYTFLGYYDSPEGGKQIYDKDGTSTLVWKTAKDTTLFAHWQATTTLVSFDQNTGTGGQTVQVTATYDSDMPAITAKPTKGNHIFLGYFDDASGGTKYYNADLTSATKWNKVDATATLYAQWQINSYTFTWNANGGNWSGSSDDKTTTVNHDALVTPPKEPSRPGYKFDGWYKEGLTVPWNFQTDKPTQNTTLYAKWSEQILCTVPVSTLLQVDAKGDVTDITGTTHQFASQTTAPIVVTSATSTLLAGANSLFPDEAARKDVAILIKPEGGQQKSIPLATATPVSLGFQIDTEGTLPVSFGLHLPATARLNYLANDGTAEIASISYTVSLAIS